MKLEFGNNIDIKKAREFMTYFENYYGADFRPGQGLDEITDMISQYSVPGTWIDLGGGTSSFIWLPAFLEASSVHSVDKYIESAYVHEQVRLKKPSGCYAHILNRYKRMVPDMNKIPITYSQMDLFNDFVIDKKYDNISQFGLLGLCQTGDEYIRQLEKLSGFMDTNSVFFGANWIFSTAYAERCGFINSYLGVKLIEEAVSSKKWSLLHIKQIPITNDPCYNSVLIYAFTRH